MVRCLGGGTARRQHPGAHDRGGDGEPQGGYPAHPRGAQGRRGQRVGRARGDTPAAGRRSRVQRGDLVRYPQSSGCQLHREGAKHSIYRNPAKRGAWTSIPRHAEIKDHLVKKLCRDLEVPPP
ncbi:MAG: type II toxin-antitoxin system HicA family toxin [Dehalococcoidia bacterium]